MSSEDADNAAGPSGDGVPSNEGNLPSTTRDAVDFILHRQPNELPEIMHAWTKAYEQSCRLDGPDSEMSLYSRFCVALVLYKQDKLLESLDAALDVYVRRVRLDGTKHLDTLLTRQHIARVLVEQGKYVQAELIFREVLAGLESINESTLELKEDMVKLLERQDKDDEALALHRDIHACRVAALGPNHLRTLKSQEGIAIVLFLKNKYLEALPVFEDIYERRVTHHGVDHPHTINWRTYMACIYDELGRKDEANKMLAGVYEAFLDKFGPDHPDTLRAHESEGDRLLEDGKYEEAMEILRDVFNRRERVCGPNHYLTISSLGTVAVAMFRQDRRVEGLKLVEDHCVKNRSNLTLSNDMAAMRLLSARKLEKGGKFQAALDIYKNLYERQLKHAGTGENVVRARADMLRMLERVGDWEREFSVFLRGLLHRSV